MRFAYHQVCSESGIMCVRRYSILARQAEILGTCLVQILIMSRAEPSRQGQQSSYVCVGGTLLLIPPQSPADTAAADES